MELSSGFFDEAASFLSMECCPPPLPTFDLPPPPAPWAFTPEDPSSAPESCPLDWPSLLGDQIDLSFGESMTPTFAFAVSAVLAFLLFGFGAAGILVYMYRSGRLTLFKKLSERDSRSTNSSADQQTHWSFSTMKQMKAGAEVNTLGRAMYGEVQRPSFHNVPLPPIPLPSAPCAYNCYNRAPSAATGGIYEEIQSNHYGAEPFRQPCACDSAAASLESVELPPTQVDACCCNSGSQCCSSSGRGPLLSAGRESGYGTEGVPCCGTSWNSPELGSSHYSPHARPPRSVYLQRTPPVCRTLHLQPEYLKPIPVKTNPLVVYTKSMNHTTSAYV